MKHFLSLLLFVSAVTSFAAGFEGTDPQAGGSYYLFNVYQAKFLSYGNAWGTQVSLDDSRPLLCTLEAASGGYVINTHYSLEVNAYKSSVNNYMIYTEELPFVNARWGDSDTNYNDREATVFSLTKADEGYYISCSDGALMFGSGTACVVGNLSESFNSDKSLWRFVTPAEYDVMQAKKTFTVAAMNVDGMPKSIKVAGVYTVNLNSDGKEADGATAIGKKMVGMGFDVIGVSEDFNYNDELMAQIGSIYSQGTHRGKIDGSLGMAIKYLAKETLFDTDGLNLFWRTDGISASGESWTAWNEHYGYDDHEADGLINKGYRYYLITLADGTQFDLYITHMEAGSDAGDNIARASQLTQLANAILASSTTRPILFMGDTNCRYSRDQLKRLFIDRINADPRFTIKDPWVELCRQGITPTGMNAIMASEYGYRRGEVVDKVLYINNKNSNIRLQAELYRQDLAFVDDSGEPLADHWPCVVTFSYHDYDPLIDDVADVGTVENVYLRNRATGFFLKEGGWWGTHAVQGDYGCLMTLTQLPTGKYAIQSPMGYVGQDDPYMDTPTQLQWTLIAHNGAYSLTYDKEGTTKALTANDPATFPYAPNRRYVTCATYSDSDPFQQWEMLTGEDLLAEMRDAIGDYNATFLLPGANFDRNDPATNIAAAGGPWDCSITIDASKMTYNFWDGRGDWERGNFVGEVFNHSYDDNITSYETTWEISQTLTEVPDGSYTVSCQAFYRDGEINQNIPGTIHSYLYARTGGGKTEVKTPVQSIYSAHCTEALSGTTDASGYYIPNSMWEASQFFSNGYYADNAVDINVTDNTLTVAIGKPDVTKSTSGWTCFDNFQLIYHGSAIIGDVNRDGSITIADVTALVDIILGKDSVKPFVYNHVAADVNQDSSITIADVTALVDIILGKNN